MSATSPNSEALGRAVPPCVIAEQESAAWFTEEVYRHDRALKAYLRAQYPSVRDVEDVMQESYIRLWRMRVARRIEHTKSFLFTVARHLAIDVVRRGRKNPVREMTDFDLSLVLDEASDIRETAAWQEDLDLLASAIASLPERCRIVFVLCRMRGVPHKEAADRLGLSVGTVENQVGRALRRIQKYLEEHRKP